MYNIRYPNNHSTSPAYSSYCNGTRLTLTLNLTLFSSLALPRSSYCNGTGLTTPSGLCIGGFDCTSGSVTPMPTDSGVTEAPCTVGHHCPAGTAVPLPCDHGTYMNMTGAEQCWNCTPGCVGGYDVYI